MKTLRTKGPGITVIHTINDPAAEGAVQALRNAGKEGQAIIVSVDGGCPGTASVKSGVIGATSQHYPLKLAATGIDASATHAKDSAKRAAYEGLLFFHTSVTLIPDQPVGGGEALGSIKGTAICGAGCPQPVM